jgi:pimeloyl-ACP methyl ester carboxylesterase
MEGDIEQLRRDPSIFASLELSEVVDHYEHIIHELETPPIIIGLGFGALVTQILLDRGWGAAGVAVAPAPTKGFLRGLLPSARAYLNGILKGNRANSINPTQFRRSFANNLTESESRAAFEHYVVPGPNRMLWQAAFAMFAPRSTTSINFRNDTRAPLLLVAGGRDRIAPPSLVKENLNLYRRSKATTNYKEFSEEDHFTLLREIKVADCVLGWALNRIKGSQARGVSGRTDGWSVEF